MNLSEMPLKIPVGQRHIYLRYAVESVVLQVHIIGVVLIN